MPDLIRIQIVRGCDEQGQGGTVVDDAAGVLGTLGETAVLDLVVAAFADTFGIYSYPNPAFDDQQPESEANPRTLSVTPYRNVSYRLRAWSQEIVAAYAAKVAAEQARQQATQQTSAALAAVQVVEMNP